MTTEEIKKLCKQYTMFTWNAQAKVNPPVIKDAEGVYLYGNDGEKWLDLTSELVNVNIGFKNKHIIEAVQEMVEELPYVSPRFAYEKRGIFGKKLIEDFAPKGEYAKVLFTNGGADANEYAIRLAKAFTGKNKIFSKYCSYHGSTYGAACLTGEGARSSPNPQIAGFVRFEAPHLYTYDLEFESEEAATAHFLARLENQILMEGKNDIAALFIESLTGSNGAYPYPKGYLKGVRELCTKYGILMVCDEVMVGFGRTGKWFTFEHDDIIPDMFTTAKGISSGYVPLGGLFISNKVSEFFDEHGLPAGLTYNSHGLAVAAGLACVEEYQRLNILDNVNKMSVLVMDGLKKLKEKHPSIGDVRGKGLHCAIEFVKDRETKEPLPAPDGGELSGYLTAMGFEKEGLAGFGHDNFILVSPPLIINESEVEEMLCKLDKLCGYADQLL